MGISYEKEKKIKTILGSVIAVASLAYGADWGALQQNPAELITLIAGFFGISLAATGPSVTK